MVRALQKETAVSSEYDPRQAPAGRATAGQAPAGQATAYAGTAPAQEQHRAGGGAALGFTWFAASLLVLGGIWQFFAGLAAVIKGSFFLVTPRYAYNISIHSWGWIHIGIGAALFLIGCCLFARQTWARVIAIFIAVISAVMNFLFIPKYPFWAITMAALDVVIVWALVSVGKRRA